MTEAARRSVSPGLVAYCTLFDSGYLLKGVVMLESLLRATPGAIVYVLCMDERSHQILGQLDLRDVRLLRLSDVEDDDLRRVKPTRTRAEYCWTLSPALCRHVIDACPEAEFVTYLDADLMFFSDVAPLIAGMGNASVSITAHRYPPALEYLSVYGRFNVQWVLFRRDEIGLACLDRWREQCIEWCHAWLEDGKLGDQKYLDAWPDRYGAAVDIVAHPGAGVGPWNVFAARVEDRGGDVRIDGQPLIFYHFHQFELLADGTVDEMPPTYLRFGSAPAAIYGPYEAALRRTLVRVRGIEPGFSDGVRSASGRFATRLVRRFVPAPVKNLLRRLRIKSW